jgi:hypothetical protein
MEEIICSSEIKIKKYKKYGNLVKKLLYEMDLGKISELVYKFEPFERIYFKDEKGVEHLIRIWNVQVNNDYYFLRISLFREF